MLHKLLAAGLLLAAALPAQTPEKPPGDASFYRLNFTIRETDAGKAIQSRDYSVSIALGKGASLRTGNRIPYENAPGIFNYADVGVNIDCRANHESAGQLALWISAELSTAVTPPDAPTPPRQPVIRQNKWSADVLLPLRKPTVVFSADDLTSKRQLQLEVTATPISR